jgi:ribonuclease D
MHRVRSRRQLAVIRALWYARDELASQRDVAPGRVLPDAAIIAAATTAPNSADALGALPGWGGRWTRQLVPRMWPVIRTAYRVPDDDLPRSSVPGDGPPPVNRWSERSPEAADRLARAREAVGQIAAQHNLPVENLLSPELVRRLAWTPTEPEPDAVAAYLREAGARPWQVELTAGPLATALA